MVIKMEDKKSQAIEGQILKEFGEKILSFQIVSEQLLFKQEESEMPDFL